MKKQISYHYRLYLEVSFVILILMVIVGVFFYQYDARLMRESVEENTLEALTTLHMRIDDRLTALDGVAEKIQVSEKFQEIVSGIPEGKDNYFQKYPRAKETVNQLILQNLVSEELGTNAHFISQYWDVIGVYMRVDPYNRVKITKEMLQKDPDLNQYMGMNEYVSYALPHRNKWYSEESVAFSVFRPVRDNFQTFGVLEISQTMRELDELLTLEEFPDWYEIRILDEQGNSTYTFDYDERELLKDKNISLEKSKEDIEYIDGDFLACSHKSKLTGWTVVMIRSLNGLHEQLSSFCKLLLGVFFVIFACVLIFLFMLTKSLTRPLSMLKDKLCTLQMDEEIHLDVKAESNEVTALTVGIEEFLNQIRSQNRLMIEIRKRALKAQLDRMEAQMNPHFLYNALAVMGACGQEDGSERVYQMSCGLAELLRYSVKYDHALVELKDEIRNVRNYLLIMGLRYEEQVNIIWNLDDSLDKVMVPKLSFQPVLENCFKHGFKSRKNIWQIDIYSKRCGNQWRFIVRNNGEPFAEERIRNIRERYNEFARSFTDGSFDQEKDEPVGLGLENTLKRLFIQYGNAAFWDIRTENGWTIVEIGGVIVEEKDSGFDC